MPALLLALLAIGQLTGVRVVRDTTPGVPVVLPMGVPDLCFGSPDNVAAGQSVTISGTVSRGCLGIHGTVTVTGGAKLTATTILVYPDGAFNVEPGTEKTEIVIRDTPLDLVRDPEQFGNGLVVFGRVIVNGQRKTPASRVAAEVRAGDRTVRLNGPVPSDWFVGDDITIPASKPRSLFGTVAFQQYGATGKFDTYDDRRTIAAISGDTITLSAPATWDHPGGLDKTGAIVLLPHVMNLTRSVVFRSENPHGVRGHVMVTQRAYADVQGALFLNLGRTTNGPLDCTRFTDGAFQTEGDCAGGTGPLTHIGTNEKGRYAFHWHMYYGPINPTNTGYQGRFVGNAIVESLKWPLAVHQSSYIFGEDIVIAYGQAAGLMFENGNEHFNVFNRVYITAMTAIGNPREQEGREASGIWMKGSTNNRITNSVVAGLTNAWQQIVNEVGYKVLIPASGMMVKRPNFRGADMDNPAQYTLVNAQTQPILEFRGNEAYGVSTGFTVWNANTDGYTIVGETPSTIQDFTAWNFWEEAVFAYPVHNWIFDGLVMRGHPQSFFIVQPTLPTATGLTGFAHGDYKVNGITLRRVIGSNLEVGIYADSGWDGRYTIETADLHAKSGLLIAAFATPGAMATPIADRTLTATDVTYSPVGSFPYATIWKVRRADLGPPHFDALPERTQIVRYNGMPESFFVYYPEQATQNVSGGLAPCTTTRPDITALVCSK